jgi:hypothetical protein
MVGVSVCIRLPRRRQWFASFHDVDGEHFCGPVPDLYFVHGAGDNVPGFTRADWLVRLAPLQDRKTAFQQLSGIETRVCVQPGIYVWRHLDEHHHRFVATIGHVEFFHDGARDWLRHYIPPELAAYYSQAAAYQESLQDPKGEKRSADTVQNACRSARSQPVTGAAKRLVDAAEVIEHEIERG